MGQLSDIGEEDVFEELELLENADLSNVEYMVGACVCVQDETGVMLLGHMVGACCVELSEQTDLSNVNTWVREWRAETDGVCAEGI
jgi:hypothetical protein